MKPAITLLTTVILLSVLAACGRKLEPISPSQAKQEQQKKQEKQNRGLF